MESETPFNVSFRRVLEKPGTAAVILLLLTLIYTYPIVFHLSTHVIAEKETTDVWLFVWNQFVFAEQVLHGHDPLFTDCIYHPVGTSLLFHSYSEFNNVIALLLRPFLGDITSHNLVRLLATFLTGIGMYVLAKEVTKNSIAALFAAIAFAFCPFRMIRPFGHINFESTEWLPFEFWALLRLGDTRRLRYVFLMGLFFALTYYCNPHYAIFLILAFALILAYGIWRFSDWRSFRFLNLVLLAGALAIVLLLPIILHLVNSKEVQQADTQGANIGLSEIMSAKPGDYFRPANPVLQKLTRIKGYSRTEERIGLTPGWTVLLLSLIGIAVAVRFRERRLLMWGILALAFLVLSLGPFLKTGRTGSHVLLPFYLITKIPYVNNERVATRFAVIVSLAMSLPAAYTVSLISGKLKGSRANAALAILFGLLLLESAAFPVSIMPFDPPEIFYTLGKTKAEEVMVTVPLNFNTVTPCTVVYQIVHKRELLNGKVSREPRALTQYFSNIPVAGSLRSLRFNNAEEDQLVAPFFRQFFNVRYMTLFPPFGSKPEIVRYVQSVFPDATLLAAQKGFRVYSLPPTHIRHFRFERVDKEIGYFLFDNWKVTPRLGNQIRSMGDRVMLLLPNIKENETLNMKLRIRSLDDAKGEFVRLHAGDDMLVEMPVSQEPEPLRFDISETLFKKAHGLIEIQLLHQNANGSQSNEKQHWPLELCSVEGNLRRHGTAQ